MKNWHASVLVAIGLIVAPWLAEASIHRKACENPMAGVSVCWDATAEEETEAATGFSRLHLLPIARQVAGQPEVLVDMSRTIFRQLLPGRLAEQLVPEWTPAYHLEGALSLSQNPSWPALLWISPREIRNSAPGTSGLLDWDVYLISKGQLVRTMRIRVESNPNRTTDGLERATTLGSALAITGTVLSNPLSSAATVTGAYAMGQSNPPEAGQPLELLTEFATRQVIFILRQAMETLPGPKSETVASPWSLQNAGEVAKRTLSPK